ncbi:glycosyltransferase [Egicoccus halophilus]|uniref:Uncharacterized protein n=1 Tax=Egicoccus halophilus TaxID=1670830 RepID=A0A8J3AE88_9ACTN|nr:glycosyltransferase [Egicoccus halophilus]GGI05436.1 hypothetical protein GCM10011354_14090 [Egicoccus halophilus]
MNPLSGAAQAARLRRDWLQTRAKVLRPALRTLELRTEVRPARGAVLLSYMTEAFALQDGTFPAPHTNLWECREIARTYLELGYDVDVVNYRNFLFTPRRHYDLVIDTRNNLERLAPLLDDDCIRVHHIEVQHLLFQNAAEFDRLVDLQQRRGVSLQPRRVERRTNLAIEHADLGVLYGGRHAAQRWAYAGKPLYPVPGTPIRTFDRPVEKDVDRVRNRFVFLSSGGLVLRGLDLVLEAFAELPDCHLTVCGPIDDEPDFRAAFHRELFETPNITTLGWVDVTGPQFEALMRDTIGLVYPTASDAQSGSVITAMHAGLIPIMTPAAGIDAPADAAVVLQEASVASIRSAVGELAARSTDELRQAADRAWTYARSTHTRSRFAAAYRELAAGLVGDAPMPRPVHVPTATVSDDEADAVGLRR